MTDKQASEISGAIEDGLAAIAEATRHEALTGEFVKVILDFSHPVDLVASAINNLAEAVRSASQVDEAR